MPAKIIWMSQHVPTPRQLGELERLFPNFDLHVDARSFDGADDIVARYHHAKANEMVVVAPLLVVRELVRRGLRPIVAEMRQVPCSGANVEVRAKRRCYQFVRYKRLTGVHLDYEDVHRQPLTPLRPLDQVLLEQTKEGK